MMASFAEQYVSRSLRLVLAELPVGADIPETDEFKSLLSGLEHFVPELLRELHSEWARECLDGVHSFSAKKTGTRDAAIFGMCILISDQTWTPLEMRLQIASSTDQVNWLECRLGEQGDPGMVRVPYPRLNEMSKQFYCQAWGPETIDWVYAVTFGERASD